MVYSFCTGESRPEDNAQEAMDTSPDPPEDMVEEVDRVEEMDTGSSVATDKASEQRGQVGSGSWVLGLPLE